MQLKRDTEYALRILNAIARSSDIRKDPPYIGVPLSEIRALSGVPGVAIDRICSKLESAGLIACQKEKSGEKVYTAASDLRQKSLLDVIRTTEQGIPLFAVFDKDSGFFQRNENRLLQLQSSAEKLLDGEKLIDYCS